MQGVRSYPRLSDGIVRLELTPTTSSPLAIDVSESTEMRIKRLISENPVIIFSRPSCCMCHAMKKLLSDLRVHPTVIELDEDEIRALPAQDSISDTEAAGVVPTLFIGETHIGGLASVFALHVTGQLVRMLVQVGALSSSQNL